MLKKNTIKINNFRNYKKFQPYASIQGFYEYNLLENKVLNVFNVTNGITTRFYKELSAITNVSFLDVKRIHFNDLISNIQNQRFAIGITSFSPTTITAGTQSVLTITGVDFGATQGSVRFSDGNDGGATFYSALDSQVLSWTDTQIQVEVPSRAGTGSIQVTSATPTTVTSGTNLTVSYAEINVNFDPGSGTESYITQHVNRNSNGGYIWQMFTDFDANTAAKESFIRAFDTWRCETGVYWEIGTTTTTDVIANDDINVVRFDNGSELSAGVLGVCISRFSGCSGPSGIEWYVEELDIVFDDGTNWQFGPASPAFTEFDFETVAVHELGHGHQLSHVINPGAIMHYALSNGSSNRALGTNDIAGGNDVFNRSSTTTSCGNTAMGTFNCATLSTDAIVLEEEISIFPNPANNNLYIRNNSYINLKDVSIYDVNGRLISIIDVNESSRLKTIDISSLSSGMYFINIKAEDASLTKKLIIE